jgi:glycosyltransferase involved in cell wall biosynthesis
MDQLAFLDGDGQFDPVDLEILVGLLDQADLVTGRRVERADAWYRSMVASVLNQLVRLIYGVKIPDVDCGFKVMQREVFEQASPILSTSARFNTEIFYKAERCGFEVAQNDVTHLPRCAASARHQRLSHCLANGDLQPQRGWGGSLSNQRDRTSSG